MVGKIKVAGGEQLWDRDYREGKGGPGTVGSDPRERNKESS